METRQTDSKCVSNFIDNKNQHKIKTTLEAIDGFSFLFVDILCPLMKH